MPDADGDGLADLVASSGDAVQARVYHGRDFGDPAVPPEFQDLQPALPLVPHPID